MSLHNVNNNVQSAGRADEALKVSLSVAREKVKRAKAQIRELEKTIRRIAATQD